MMPKTMIANWNERRVTIIFLITTFVFATAYLITDYFINILPSYNSMSTIIDAWFETQNKFTTHMQHPDGYIDLQYNIDNVCICSVRTTP